MDNITCNNRSINQSLIFGVGSLDADHTSTYIIRGWISCFVCVFGFIGNIINISVLTRPSLRKHPINIILLFLSICDSVYILLYLLYWSIPNILARFAMEEDILKMNNYYMTIWRPITYPVFYAVLWTAQNSSVALTILLTLERYIYVCKPLESNKIATRQRITIVCLMTIFGFIIYEIPLYWRFYPVNISGNCSESLYYIAENKSKFMKIYNSKFKILLLHYVFPLLILFVLNWKITKALKEIENRRKKITKSEARNISYTKIVICVISLSCVTDVFFLIVTIAGYLKEVKYNLHTFYTLMKDFVDLFLLTNSSINFIFYCVLGTAFKQQFIRTFIPWHKLPPSVVSEVSDTHGGGDTLKTNSNH